MSLVPWDSLPPADQIFLRDKYPDAGQGAVCDFCVRSARPTSFFNRRSSGAPSSAPQSVDSGLQVPLVVSGAATSLVTESVELGISVCICLLVAGFVGALKTNFFHQDR